MIASVMGKIGITLLMFPALGFLVSCAAKQQSQEAKSNQAQSTSTTETGKQTTPNDTQVKEEILGLRRLLYADDSLQELASSPDEGNTIIDDASRLIENGKPQQALDVLQRANGKSALTRDPAYWIVAAYARHQLGDLQGARQSLQEVLKLPEVESRILLNVWKVLRDLGDKSETKKAGRVLGVIAEIGYKGTVVIVAGYADGESRLFLGSGGGLIGGKESFPEEARRGAKELVAAAQPFVNNLPLEAARELPKQGQVRFALLTSSGTYIIKDEIDHLERTDSQYYRIWRATNMLLTPLLRFMSEEEKK